MREVASLPAAEQDPCRRRVCARVVARVPSLLSLPRRAMHCGIPAVIAAAGRRLATGMAPLSMPFLLQCLCILHGGPCHDPRTRVCAVARWQGPAAAGDGQAPIVPRSRHAAPPLLAPLGGLQSRHRDSQESDDVWRAVALSLRTSGGGAGSPPGRKAFAGMVRAAACTLTAPATPSSAFFFVALSESQDIAACVQAPIPSPSGAGCGHGARCPSVSDPRSTPKSDVDRTQIEPRSIPDRPEMRPRSTPHRPRAPPRTWVPHFGLGLSSL